MSIRTRSTAINYIKTRTKVLRDGCGPSTAGSHTALLQRGERETRERGEDRVGGREGEREKERMKEKSKRVNV